MLLGRSVKVVTADRHTFPASVVEVVWRLVLTLDEPFTKGLVAALCVECGVDESPAPSLAENILSAARRRGQAKFNKRMRTWSLTRKTGDPQ